MELKTPQLITYWIDASGSKGTLRFNLRPGASFSAIEAGAASMRGLVASMSDAVCIGQEIAYQWVETDVPTPSGSRLNSQPAVFIWACDTEGQMEITWLAAASNSIYQTTGDHAGVDVELVSNADVTAFIAGLVGGIWCNPFGHDLVECVSAFYVERP